MAPTSLLRYIFRHGPHPKARVAAPSPRQSTRVAEAAEIATKSLDKQHSHREVMYSNEPSKSPLAYKSRTDSRQSSILDDIAEESSNNSSSDEENESVGQNITAPGLNIRGYTTQELLTATLSEAKMALHAHLDTINTTLGLLDALEGFSATVAVLRDEMMVKKETCEEKMEMLEDVEDAVATT
ncbi:hypothetical protein BDU57DRAFT_534504 [Ampelomyces quisqualis]|uniref:Uncharacterized protein n=1 Tax=Ampelomyces quisqualis TaxID=50730 RepID=A0A6A5R476_AMPQU|nr:hypothetical protein BDU57DRAFT_534504 [Ampelomyces quisqualis]